MSEADVPLGSSVELGATRGALLPSQIDAGALSERTELAGLVGRSAPMRRLFAEIERVAPPTPRC